MNIRIVDILARSLRRLSFSGKARLLDAVCPHNGERLVDIFGYHIRLDLEDFIQRRVYLQTFEPYETAIVRAHLAPGDVFVDVGANIGYFTLLAASLVTKRGRVLAFEPSPYASSRLRDTILSNSVSHVEVKALALGQSGANLPLYLPIKKGNHSPTMLANEGGKPLNVTVRRLDDCLHESHIDQVDFMKIDVEGFEPDVLKGAGEFLSRGAIRAVLCEFNEYWLTKNGFSSVDLYDLFLSHGFRLAERPGNFIGGNDNLLFMCRTKAERAR